MSRSTKKGPYVDERLLDKIAKHKKAGKKQPIKTWARSSVIIPEWVGLTFLVHNGKKFIPVYVTEAIVGHRLGEFSPTRFFKGHGQGKRDAVGLKK
ncbi:MAG: 30S ribosomal protein S19 [Elusimicrobia bacterium CG_4_10_14_3_um_filter_49_12_50_7]|nr:MAG: 30S ribosomal protein S19 [Elusimicrobia bacterium CG03_land_8_20_14_0_80_50_18]PIX13749.1 MAG: 30S ribosomal protein S19 [Elusimicrobia bacterium CG_4_8_14_3_um_filter_50_9]PIY15141.1 MAG: 30S ribosomal protein S19 [Elusimicrobia bacterium CG_4_10_14_3_um_filter_49_12_50_7]